MYILDIFVNLHDSCVALVDVHMVDFSRMDVDKVEVLSHSELEP
jgi:hypothetical protein